MVISNPVLKGFHPDPSILRVGEDYYLATSTFEWFPGVQIYHSKDLVHWQLLTYPLTRKSQLNMEGVINSGGVWAPCLSYADGLFYLIYTVVLSRKGAFKDTHNYLVTAEQIDGPWSEPVYLNSSGFDPSLFHDEDGRKWLVNMLWDHRKGNNKFAGIVLQEYSASERRLVGPIANIFKGTVRGLTEGPHLYKRDGMYYLMTAEGGTQYRHAVTMARSKTLLGPYEADLGNPILTAEGHPEGELQKAGHGSLVETHTGEWYMAHLCARPTVDRFCTLGRETALQRCYWTEDGWLRVEGGGIPLSEVQAPRITPMPYEPLPEKDDFNEPQLELVWNTLRIPSDESWLSLTERPGFLRLKGMESMSSTHRQSMVARRQESFHLLAETSVEFEPEQFHQMAGLILYYDTEDYVYLRVTHKEGAGRVLGIVRSVKGQYDEVLEEDIPLQGTGGCRLRAEIHRERLQLSYAAGNDEFQLVGPVLDIRNLSDDDADYIRFTGTFIGVCVQDLSGTRRHADFDYFLYRELPDREAE